MCIFETVYDANKLKISFWKIKSLKARSMDNLQLMSLTINCRCPVKLYTVYLFINWIKTKGNPHITFCMILPGCFVVRTPYKFIMCTRLCVLNGIRSSLLFCINKSHLSTVLLRNSTQIRYEAAIQHHCYCQIMSLRRNGPCILSLFLSLRVYGEPETLDRRALRREKTGSEMNRDRTMFFCNRPFFYRDARACQAWL